MAARPFFTSGRYLEGLESGNKKPATGITRTLGSGGLQFVRVRTADGGVCDAGPALFSRRILHENSAGPASHTPPSAVRTRTNCKPPLPSVLVIPVAGFLFPDSRPSRYRPDVKKGRAAIYCAARPSIFKLPSSDVPLQRLGDLLLRYSSHNLLDDLPILEQQQRGDSLHAIASR